MPEWLLVLWTSVTTVAASTGLWTYLQRRNVVKSQTDRLLRGIAYEKIVSMGMLYIERGWITQDEYEEYRKYLYEPYRALGGNGVTERVVAEVSNLPLRSRAKFAETILEAKSRSQDNVEPELSAAA